MEKRIIKWIVTTSILIIGSTLLAQTITDIDNNEYKTVKIGNQTWMAENLKVTKYRNGDSIQTTPMDLDVSDEVTPKYQWIDKVEYYGRLYTWYTINDSRGLCPSGWHIPSDNELTILIDYLGGNITAGGKLKDSGTTFWQAPNTGGTNESGFTGYPGGIHSSFGGYNYVFENGYWWTSTESESTFAYMYYLYYNSSEIVKIKDYKRNGLSVRCLKD